MILKRTSRDYQKKWLRENKNLKILDLGCSLNNYWSEANHFADLDDFSLEFGNLKLRFTSSKTNRINNMVVNLIGDHNVTNATAAIAIALNLGTCAQFIRICFRNRKKFQSRLY